MAKYYGMVKCIDDRMGELLAQLRELEIFDNTVVVLTSDHGDLRGEHNRQNKGVPYEASAKIPFLLQYPAKIKNPKVVNEALTCIDFLPTVLKIMEVKTAGEEEGRDASALFLSDKTPTGWKDVGFMRGTGEKTWLAAVTDRYKLVVSPFADPWLFDLEEDADEMKNFFGSAPHRETIRDLSRELLAYGQKFGDPVMTSNAVQTDLKWGAEGEGAYSPPERKARPKPNPLRRKLEEGKKRQKRKKKNTASS